MPEVSTEGIAWPVPENERDLKYPNNRKIAPGPMLPSINVPNSHNDDLERSNDQVYVGEPVSAEIEVAPQREEAKQVQRDSNRRHDRRYREEQKIRQLDQDRLNAERQRRENEQLQLQSTKDNILRLKARLI